MRTRNLVISVVLIAIILVAIFFATGEDVYKQIDTKENPRYIGIKYPDLKKVEKGFGGSDQKIKEVWISEAYGHSIAIFDADRDMLKKRISVPDPGDIDFGPENAYVGSKVQPYIYVIDIETKEIKRKIKIGYPITDVEYIDKYNKVYVANFLGHTVNVIDLNKSEIVKEIFVGSGPREISVTPDEEEAWVAVHNIDNVSVIDTKKDEVKKDLYLYDKVPGDMPLWITFANGKAYVALHQLSYLAVIDMETKEILGVIETSGGSRAIGTSPDGDFVYDALLYQDRLEIINTTMGEHGKVINSLPLGKTPMNLDVSPTNKVYVANTQSDTVSVLRPNREPSLIFKVMASLPSLPAMPWNVKTVLITKDGYKPRKIEIQPGDSIKWVNKGNKKHDISIAPPNKMWFALDLPNGNEKRSPTLEPGESWTYKFKQRGEYKYWCKQEGHWENEKGSVLVGNG